MPRFGVSLPATPPRPGPARGRARSFDDLLLTFKNGLANRNEANAAHNEDLLSQLDAEKELHTQGFRDSDDLAQKRSELTAKHLPILPNLASR